MKKWLIATMVASFALAGSLAVVGITSTPATAQTADNPLDEAVSEWVSTILDRLVDLGILTEEGAAQLERALPNIGLLWSTTPDDAALGPTLDELRRRFRDLDGVVPRNLVPEDLLRRIGPNGDPGNPQGLPPAFDLDELRRRFLELRPDQATPRDGLRGLPRGQLFRFFGDLTPDELRDAIENGTVGEVIDTDQIIADASARLDAAVEAGRLTRKQADAILDRLTETLDRLERGEIVVPFARRGPGSLIPRGGAGQSEQSGTSA